MYAPEEDGLLAKHGRMKAVVVREPGRIVYRDVPRPILRGEDALVAVRAAGICGSELPKAFEGHSCSYPIILGHEFAGEISGVGAMVDPSLVGRHVAAIPLLPCGTCDACQKGQYFWCDTYSFVGARQDGGFAQLVALPARNLLQVPEDMPWEHAALLEPTSVGLHVADWASTQTGDAVAVFGLGPIGLLTLQWLKIRGCGKVYAIDVVDRKCQLARELGADISLNASEGDPVAEIAALTRSAGVPLAIETSGAPAAFAQALQVLSIRGRLVQVGFMSEDPMIHADTFDLIVRKEIEIRGSSMSYSAPFPGYEWPTALRFIHSGRIQLDPLITHRVPLQDGPAALDMMASGREFYVKVVLIP